MSDLAPPVIRPFGWARDMRKPRAALHDLVPLLKVRALHAVFVTLLVVAQYWLQLASSLGDRPRLLVEVFLGMFAWNVPSYIVAFSIIAVVQARITPGRMRTMLLLCAMVVWTLLWSLWHFLAGSHFIVVQLGLVSSEAVTVHGLWAQTTYLLIAAWYYESIDRATRSRAALRESELARRSAERWLLELRLGTLQARVDPQVLSDTLDEVGRLYRSRPAAAEQLLDALIDYLRRALPRLRLAESTLEREIALALAYARILRTRDGEPFELEAVVDPAAVDARFPPMVAQPLCEAIARPAMAGDAPARICIDAVREQDLVRLNVSVQPVQAGPSRERLAEIRHTLLTMFGPEFRMGVAGPVAGVARVAVEVPYDAAPRTDS